MKRPVNFNRIVFKHVGFNGVVFKRICYEALRTRASPSNTLSCKTLAYSNCSGLIRTLRNTVINGASQIKSECIVR
jgi:hypothetical protein